MRNYFFLPIENNLPMGVFIFGASSENIDIFGPDNGPTNPPAEPLPVASVVLTRQLKQEESAAPAAGAAAPAAAAAAKK